MKKTLLSLAAALTLATPLLAVPQYADAARPRDWGRGDICADQRRAAGHRGAVVGAVVGGIIGNRVAGRGDRTAGTVIGAGVGGLAGNSIGRSNFRCIEPPRQASYRANCQWLEDEDGPFRVCRNRNGNWRYTG